MKMIESSVLSMRELTIANLYGTWLITGEGKHLQSRINSETEHYQENGMAQMMYMAAVVELIEPTCTHPWENTETTLGGGVRCTKCNTILN